LLLALDVGNTNITLGLYSQADLLDHWRVSTRREATADELGAQLLGLLGVGGYGRRDVSGVVVSSVVPPLVTQVTDMCRRYFSADPLVVGPGTKTGVPILYDSPRDVGADRIVNAVAAIERYGCPAVVVDFGTATTFDAISERGEYLGGAIAPGIGTSTEALFRRAAKLPRVDLVRPTDAIGKNTVHSMQSGIVFGFAGQVDSIVRRFALELGALKAVIATGGLAPLIAPECDVVTVVDTLLTLEGLRLIHDRNH